MRSLKTVAPALMALLLLAMAASPISAQSDPAAEGVQLEDLEGLQRAVARSYSADMMAMFDPENPDAMPAGWFILNVMVLEFDNEDNAAAASDSLNEELEAGAFMDEGAALEDVELDVDFDYTAKQYVEEQEGMMSHALFATARHGTYLQLVTGVTLDEDPVPLVSSVISTVADADAEDGEGTFSDDGTSEGGLWAKLPTQAQMQEQNPVFTEGIDEVLFPVAGATPAA